ncbi:hypothetical protein BT96DRAFT_923788 [Gymnopus androsaceus JB14]|uniref:G-protein coupled receptors family 1 profile domain-containing protein n=1 Tax=Gymnopus androsaceus JB14 TaxID=1447944 RepID=A0A6A4H8E5_9AGAR|nr:hypothetical protein BT96DRAFT_923788 [Gymnopus androsaceus JB14]
MTQLQVELEEQVEFEIAALGFAVFENAYTLIFVGVLNGLYLLAFGICMHIVITKKRNGRANQVMITLLVASFLMTVLFFIGYLMVPLVLVEFELMKVLPGGLMVQEIAASTQSMLVGAAICETWTVNLSVLIADAFVVWVAWVIWPRNRGFHCALAILMLVDIGLTFAVAIPSSENTLAVLKATTNTLDCVKILCSLLVNVVATLAIGYQGWKHHQSMQIISFRNQKTQVAAIFLLLVESGAIFGFIQVSLNAHVATGSPLDKATNFLVILYVYAAGLNPVAIAVLVRLKRNYHDEPESSELPP